LAIVICGLLFKYCLGMAMFINYTVIVGDSVLTVKVFVAI